MTMTIDEALNRAEAMSAGLDWILLSQYEVKAEYASPEVSIDLDNRVIGGLSENVSTEGENNAEYISFIMDRYHDGVDLSNMLIQIQYELEDGSGSIDGVVNAYMNDDQIKFGWVVPPAAAQVDAVIKIMVFCTGTIGAKNYTLKTLPIEYTIHSTLKTGGSIPEPDENWYIQFANTMQQNVLAAKASADAAAQSASDASDDLADIKDIQSDVNTSKSTVQTLAAQVQSNTTKAQESADAAKVSEETAKSWAERAQESSGVNYASKELAGIVAPQDVYVNPENGHMSLVTQTTDKTLPNSYSGGIKINEVQGKSEQKQYSGKNLLSPITFNENEVNGITIKSVTENGMLQYLLVNGTSTAERSVAIGTCNIVNGTEYIMNGGTENARLVINNGSSNFVDNAIPKKFTAQVSETQNVKLYVPSGVTLSNVKVYPMIRLASESNDTYEPYVGGIPSPNPDYPQEIKSVEVSKIKSIGKNFCDWTKGKFYVKDSNSIVKPRSGYYYDIIYDTTGEEAVLPDVDKLPYLKAGSYTIKWEVISGTSSISVMEIDRNGNPIKKHNNTNSPSTFTLEKDTYVTVKINTFLEISIRNIQIEKGTVATEYEPYTESVVSLSSPITLRGIEDVKDRIVNKDGVYGVERNIDEISSYNGESISTPYISTTGSLETGAKVIYQLATPTFEPLPVEDKIALYGLKSFDTVTYISTDSEIEPVIDLEYGTSRVGGYALETWNTAERNEIRITALEAAQKITTEEEVIA